MELDCLGISLCDGKRACYIVLGENYEGLVEGLRDHLLGVPRLLFHHAPFDMRVLYKLGIDHTENVICTMTAQHLLDEEGPKGLKDLAIQKLGVPESSIVRFEQAYEKGINSEEFYQYAMNDAIYTWALWQLQAPQIESEGLSKLFYSIEMPFQYVLRDMEINGILIDKAALYQAREWIRKELIDAGLAAWDAGGIKYKVQHGLFGVDEYIPEVNLGSPKQMIEFIEGRLGITLEPDENGGKSVDKHTLESLQGRHDFFKKLLYYRQVAKLSSSFLEKLPECLDEDGRLRTTFHNTVAVTGRLSSSDPPMQQLPKKGTGLANVRSLIIAPPGKVLIGGDYSGQELRVLADVTGDVTMIDAFFRKQDVHLALANGFMDLGIEESLLFESNPKFAEVKKKFKDQRDKCKTINFGIPYGKTAYGFANDWNVSEEEAQKTIDLYFGKFPRIQEAIGRTVALVRREGYIHNLFGRRRRFKYPSKRAFRQAFNFLIQGASADITKLGGIALRKLFLQHPEWEALIILQVHDEWVSEIKQEYVEVAMPLIKKALESCVHLCVPMVVELGCGDNYAECK
jgi:DNA polymerase-1